jgi:zinc protease
VDLSEPPPRQERRSTIDDKLARVTRIDMVYKIPPGNTADADALYTLNNILTSGESSRLYQKLVKEKEAASQVFGFLDARRGPGLYYLIAMVRPGRKAEEVENLISEEIARLHGEAVTEKELLRARSTIRRGVIQSRQSSLNRAIQLAEHAVRFNDPGMINTEPERRLAVTAADMQRAARDHLKSVNRVVIHTLPATTPAQKKAAK